MCRPYTECPLRSLTWINREDFAAPLAVAFRADFDGPILRDGSAILAIEAPYRAEDAALVPIAIRKPAACWRRLPHSWYHTCDLR
jgi:hypothetical protein